MASTYVELVTQLRKPKIAHLTTVHSPVDVRIYYKECTSLAEAGYEVILIAPHERDEILPNGVRLRAVPKPRNRYTRMTWTVWQVLKVALSEAADVYHFHDPELIPVGVVLKLRRNRVVYDVHENVPEDILTKNYIPYILRSLIGRSVGIAEYIATICFDGIVAATPAIARRFPRKKTVPVQNFPILDEFVCNHPVPFSARQPLIVYVGGITEIRGIREMVQAMAFIPGTVGARLVLAGECDPALESAVRRLDGAKHVEFLGWQSRNQVRDLLARARVSLVLYHPFAAHLEAQPNKLFEYMSASLPVIASDFPLWRKILGECACGLVVDPLDPESIAKAISWLLEHPEEAYAMGKRGREAVRTKYDWYGQAEELRMLYKEILAQ